jgi:ABC-2 type transport system permease protein
MKYLRILLLNFQDVFQQRSRNLIWFIDNLITPAIIILFWHGAFEKSHTIGGWDNQQMITYYIFLVVAESLLITHVELPIAYIDIKEGRLNSFLLKPISYLAMIASSELPWRFVQSIYGFIMIFVLALFSFPLTTTNNGEIILLAIVTGFFALIVSFFYKAVLGLLAFFITDIHGVQEVNEVIMAFSTGTLLPVDLFPANIKSIIDATPFPYIIYYPVTAIIGKYSASQLNHIILMQLFWIGILFVGSKLLWKYGIKRYSGVGI